MSILRKTELQELPSSGGRAVESFALGGSRWLAVPQLAHDGPIRVGINSGTSTAPVQLFRQEREAFIPAGELLVTAAEDVESFSIADRHFLAVAKLRSGDGPYEFTTESVIFEVVAGPDGPDFVELQRLPTRGAKEFRALVLDGEVHLALAQDDGAGPGRSAFEVWGWDGSGFRLRCVLPGKVGYNLQSFVLGGNTYLATADHLEGGTLWAWENGAWRVHQELTGPGTRAFLPVLTRHGFDLACAVISGDSSVWTWDGERLLQRLTLAGGPGGREWALLGEGEDLFALRVDFIHGTPADAISDVPSHLYSLRHGSWQHVGLVPTVGATDVSVLLNDADGADIAISSGLGSDLRYASATRVVRLHFTDL